MLELALAYAVFLRKITNGLQTFQVEGSRNVHETYTFDSSLHASFTASRATMIVDHFPRFPTLQRQNKIFPFLSRPPRSTMLKYRVQSSEEPCPTVTYRAADYGAKGKNGAKVVVRHAFILQGRSMEGDSVPHACYSEF